MLVTAIVFFIVLSILVLIHEFGHFIVARFVGVDVEEFGLGLPPRIWGKKIGGTLYSVNWLPIGGFVKLAGEDEEDRAKEKESKNKGRYFWARSKKERAAILTAGVTMNFLLAVLITTFLLTQGVNEPAGRVHIERVVDASPAQAAGVAVGDIVQEVVLVSSQAEPKKITKPQELIEFTRANAGASMTLSMIRGDAPLEVTVTPRKDPPEGQGPLGVAISDLELKTYPLSQAPMVAVGINLSRAWEMLRSIGLALWRLATLQPLSADIAGPVGIAQVTGEAVRYGFLALLEFVSILSLNLAVLNILPIPALDGGRLAFVFLEKFMGRRVRPAFERSAHQVGMIILFGLILLVTINDILRLVRG
jgi:regulator of sigma E protease